MVLRIVPGACAKLLHRLACFHLTAIHRQALDETFHRQRPEWLDCCSVEGLPQRFIISPELVEPERKPNPNIGARWIEHNGTPERGNCLLIRDAGDQSERCVAVCKI